jgi:hypothetical protein
MIGLSFSLLTRVKDGGDGRSGHGSHRPVSALLLNRLKVEVIMFAASRIKLRPAARTLIVALKILENAHLHTARSAQNRFLIPFSARPNFDSMAGLRIVTILARIVSAATLHFDSDNIDRLAVMSATGLRVNGDSVHCGAGMRHDSRVIKRPVRRVERQMPASARP